MAKKIKCPQCDHYDVLKEKDVQICMKCGFQTMKTYTVNSEQMKLMMNTSPKIVKSLMLYDNNLKQYWVPTIINIPDVGMVYPEGNENNWKWAYAPVVPIPAIERIKYPIPNTTDEYYETRLGVDQAIYFDKFNFKKAAKRIGYIPEKSLTELVLDKNEIIAIDTSVEASYIEDHADKSEDIKIIKKAIISDGDVYKLLKYMSTLFEGALLLDVGTFSGASSVALSYNKSNVVISYDIKDLKILKHLPENVHYKIGNVIRGYDFENVIEADLIYFDVDPHDGEQELEFYEFLKLNEYDGLVLCDDIYLNKEMTKFWNNVTHSKYDLTKYGHSSGTGLIDFSGELKVVEK